MKQYKTVWFWLHKLRAALKEEQSKLQLSGEVEIDGAEVGGYIRPKNTKKERTDFRKYPFRASGRKRLVILARERGGAAIAWVGLQEHHAVKPFKMQLEKGAVVYADGGKWTDIRAGFELHQISHKEAYYTPEACTNVVESGFRVLRVLETIHRHINHNYLDLYAAQLAWRVTHVRSSEAQSLKSLMGAMMVQSRSPLAGYFLPKERGGAKRLCEIVTETGEAGLLAAPTGRAKRTQAEGAELAPLTSALKLARSSRWNHGFTFVSAKAFMEDRSLLPSRPGVYMVMVANGDSLLARSGYSREVERNMLQRAASPLNIQDRVQKPYSALLRSLRERFRAEVSNDWLPPEKPVRPKRR